MLIVFVLCTGYKVQRSYIGSQFSWLLLILISALLLLRESFLAATINKFDQVSFCSFIFVCTSIAIANTPFLQQQNNEKLWYPLVALPEILSVIMFAVPGFVPSRDEIPEDRRGGYFY